MDLSVAFGVTAALFVLNLLINFSDDIREFFLPFSGSPLSGLLLNFLLVWLGIILCVAFVRWRRSSRESRSLDQVISGISPDCLLLVTPDRTVVMCNASVTKVFGWTPEEVMMQKTDMLYFDRRSSSARPREIYEALEKEGFHAGLATGKRKDGSTMPLEIITGELIGRSGAVLLVRDITERVRLEEEKRRLEMHTMRLEKLESLGAFAGGIAHDFNNLLTIIQGQADLARMRMDSESPVKESLNEIDKAIRRSQDLCEHLLFFSGKGEAHMEAVSLSGIVAETKSMLHGAAPKGVTLRFDLAERLPEIYGDGTQVHRVLVNLIMNGVHAIGEEEGIVRVATGVRRFEADYLQDAVGVTIGEGEYVFVEVEDTGCGMDEQTRQRLWEPFFTTKSSGHGMGMATVLGIIKSHGGAVKVESEPGQGSTLTVLFPADGR